MLDLIVFILESSKMGDFTKYIAKHNGKRYTIEPDEWTDDHTKEKVVYYYVIAWDEGYGYDDLQDTLEIAKECALEDFGVPLDSWREMKKGAQPVYVEWDM